MFPGMQGPQALPDQEAYPMFWKNLNRFLAITSVTVAVALTVRYCEQRTHSMLVATLTHYFKVRSVKKKRKGDHTRQRADCDLTRQHRLTAFYVCSSRFLFFIASLSSRSVRVSRNAMSVLPSLRPRLTAFAVVDADTKAPIGTSAPLFAPLCFTVSFTVDRPLLATAAGDACADARLCVSVEFIADVASEQPAVALLTRQAVAPAAAVDEDSNTTKSDNAATLSSSSPATTAQESRNDNSVLLVPGTVYELTCTLRDLRALQGVPLKHLLQVSMMRVRLVAANSTADDDLNKPGKVGVVAAWNVVWQVRRDPANEKELVRTVLNPLL